MNPKIDITNEVLKILNPNFSKKEYNDAYRTWWQNPRSKADGGLKLTKKGYEAFVNANLKVYVLKIPQPISVSNQMTIWMDRFIDCPFYIAWNKIHVFGSKMAVQLVIFDGNIEHLVSIKAKNQIKC
jgi:hypothetical protein